MNGMFTAALTAALAFTPFPADGTEPAGSALAALEKAVDRAAEDAGGTMGIAIVHVESGVSFGRHQRDRFPMASVFKLPVALAALHRVDEKKLSLDRKVPIRREDLREGGPIQEHFAPGMSLTVRELVEASIVDSDNTAVDVLMQILGGPRSVQVRLTMWGLPDIDVSMDEREMARLYHKGHALFEADPRNTTSPEAVAKLLVKLQTRELLSPASTEIVFDMMRRCRTGVDRIRALLPAGTPVFDKTGTVGRATNDVGLIALPDGTHLAIAIFVKASAMDSAAREHAIALAARAAWDAFVPPRAASGG